MFLDGLFLAEEGDEKASKRKGMLSVDLQISSFGIWFLARESKNTYKQKPLILRRFRKGKRLRKRGVRNYDSKHQVLAVVGRILTKTKLLQFRKILKYSPKRSATLLRNWKTLRRNAITSRMALEQ